MKKLGNFLWETLPGYMYQTDTYKDHNGKGIFQRYLSILEDDVNEVIIPLLENEGVISNPLYSFDVLNSLIGGLGEDDKFLNLIAYTLSNPIHRDIYKVNNEDRDEEDIQKEIGYYRNLLSFSLSLWKIKGTALALKSYGNILGLELEVIENSVLGAVYDEVTYDQEYSDITGSYIITYDSECQICSSYTVVVKTPSTEISEETKAILLTLIQWNEPIHAHCQGIVFNQTLIEDLQTAIQGVAQIDTILGSQYDVSFYDDGDKYDDDLGFNRIIVVYNNN